MQADARCSKVRGAPLALYMPCSATGTRPPAPHSLRPAEYRGGSGWESDADLASDEEPLSDVSDIEDSQQGLEAGEEEAGEEAAAAAEAAGQQALAQAVQPQVQQAALDASPPHGAAGWGAASDTLPISECDAHCSGSDVEQQAQHAQQAQRAAGLTSSSLSPACRPSGDILTPHGEQLLAASATPATDATAAGGDAADGVPPPPAVEVEPCAAAVGAPAAAWPGLAAKHPPLKRASHQRLSPPVVDDEALALVRPCDRQQEQAHEPEQLVPQPSGMEHQP